MAKEKIKELRICKKGGSGVLLPLGGSSEEEWPRGIRITLYFIGLVWCFMGVAIIADVFMGAIEKITSKKVRKFNKQMNRYITVVVWNPTVANLTLMALGSSAPEILLNIVEILGKDFETGRLGPSTIVGSAAFNLFCIIAICVSAFPGGETRKLKELQVFTVTAIFSIFAYLWLLVVLLGISKDVVDVWEGIATFLFFPLMVVLAFVADRGYFSKSPSMGKEHISAITGVDMTKEELAELDAQIRKKYGSLVTDEAVAKIIECSVPTSRAKYRIAATRQITASKKVTVKRLTEMPLKALSTTVCFMNPMGKNARVAPIPDDDDDHIDIDALWREGIAVIEFDHPRHAVIENAGKAVLNLTRKGDCTIPATVGYSTREGTAKYGTDFIHVDSEIEFLPGETEKSIEISIVDDTAYEEDEEFYVDLKEPDVDTRVRLGMYTVSTVVIIDDDQPGILQFSSEELNTPEKLYDHEIVVPVQRLCGGTGKVGCLYHTEDATATAGKHYEATEGFLEFEDGQLSASIGITIKAAGRYDCTEMFRVILTDAAGGAKFNKNSDGGPDSCILSIFIVSDTISKARIDKLMAKLSSNWDKAKVGHANWREQVVDALYVNGDDQDDEVGIAAYITHAVLLPWKIVFALVPPTDYCDGWICFVCSLLMIGGVTAIIGDIAALLGCVIDIPDEITAITIVAIGTSLPDTFASKTAATQDPHADASVGNVTGSNSVNVFLGLGLPWVIGSCYWASKGEQFHVPAGALAFSVMTFTICAILCISLLIFRRKACGGELGGPRKGQLLTSAFLVGLWVIYVALSSWKAVEEN